MQERKKRKKNTRDEIFIQVIQSLHVLGRDLKPIRLPVRDDPLLAHALGQRHEAVLQAPPDQDLRWSAGVFLGHGLDGGILHFQGFHERAVGFDDDVVLLAELGDVGSGEERVHFDLVDRGYDPGLGV